MKFEFFLLIDLIIIKRGSITITTTKLSLSIYRKNATTIFKTQKRGENKTLINDWRIV